jgi:hypothetical protein
VKIHEMEMVKGADPRWTAVVADKKGNKSYELTIRGDKGIVGSIFKESDFEIEIDPESSEDSGRARLQQLYDKYSVTAKDPFVDPGQDFFKKPIEKFEKANSVIVSLRRTRGKGTFFAIFLPLLPIPTGVNLFLVLPPVSTCQGTVFPISGDQDLFLTINSPLLPVVASSRLGGTAIDSVGFTAPNIAPPGFPRFPLFFFVPFFRINGFRKGVTNFLMVGN